MSIIENYTRIFRTILGDSVIGIQCQPIDALKLFVAVKTVKVIMADSHKPHELHDIINTVSDSINITSKVP